MTANLNIAQSAFDINGINDVSGSDIFVFPDISSGIKDWGFQFTYGGEFSGSLNSNLYSVLVSKKIKEHSIIARYSPGYQKDFLFKTGEEIIFSDSTSQSLEAEFSYKELFGFGYSYNFTESVTGGVNLRFFKQEFDQETVSPVFSDTVYLVRENIAEERNFWKADLGILWHPIKELALSLSSYNLFNFGETNENEEFDNYEIKKEIEIIAGISYSPSKILSVGSIYESDNSLIVSVFSNFEVGEPDLSFGINAFHDDEQDPFIAGVSPVITFSNKLFGVSLSGVKYFKERTTSASFNEFDEKGFSNIINNRYSFDKVLLTFTVKLNTLHQQRVKIIDVEILDTIFPTFTDHYVDSAFAMGKVVNLTDETITVKPAVKIEGVNENRIQSPIVSIAAFDTIEIPFYTLIPEEFNNDKPEVSYADFFLITVDEEADDEFQTAVLIQSKNSWNGDVRNLKYFVANDLNFALQHSKKILTKYKTELDTLNNSLSDFYKAKILFNELIGEMIYTSDPRSTGEYVQFPSETVELKGGDCDDLSVAYSALLESIGIETAFIDYKNQAPVRHVSLLINTGLSPGESELITKNDNKYFIRSNRNGKDEIWIPVETTSLTNFETAWNVASDRFYNEALNDLGIAKGNVRIIDIF